MSQTGIIALKLIEQMKALFVHHSNSKTKLYYLHKLLSNATIKITGNSQTKQEQDTSLLQKVNSTSTKIKTLSQPYTNSHKCLTPKITVLCTHQ